MTATLRRERLSCTGEAFVLEVEGLRYTATVGRFPNGRIGEIFLNNIGSLMTDKAARRR